MVAVNKTSRGHVYLFNDVENLLREICFFPESDRLRNVSSLDSNAVILTEDSPVTIGHLNKTNQIQ